MKLKTQLAEQSGQGIMEYLIITSLIGMVCLYSVTDLGKKITNRMNKVTKKIEKSIKIDIRE